MIEYAAMTAPAYTSEWVVIIRILAGAVVAAIAMYSLVRAFSFHGSNRYMRLCLSTLAWVLTYGQFTLAAVPQPLTTRSWVGWVGSLVALGLWLAALRADRPNRKDKQ